MASASIMEEHITCAVCFEIYRDPHALKCLHTFCLVCVKQIQRGDTVQCPECRDHTFVIDIRKDFKTSGFVDLYKQEKSKMLQARRVERKQSRQKSLRKSAGIGGSSTCDVCKIPNRSIKSKCEDCCQLMCESCAITHRGYPVCQNHEVVPMKDAIKTTIANLKGTLSDLERDKQDMTAKSTTISSKIDEIRNCHEKQIEEVNRLIDDMIQDLNVHRRNVNHKIYAANNGLVEKLKRSKEVFDESKVEVQENIDFLSEFVNREDMLALTESAKTVQANVRYDVKKLKDRLPNIDPIGSSPVTLERTGQLKPHMVVKARIEDDVNTSREEISPLLQARYSQLVNFSYKSDKTVPLEFYPQRLCQVKGNIWIAGWDGIYIYNKYCKSVQTIHHPEIQLVRSLIKAHTGDILLGCIGEKGLLRLDSNGKFKDRIANGSFNDVCAYKKHVYALDNELGKIIVLEFKSNQWIQVKEFNNLKNCERICVNCDALYISSRELHQMYVYNLHGQRMYHAGEKGSRKPGKLKHPLLCDVNNSGDALVADCDNHRMQIHYQKGGSWRIFALPGEWKWPVDTVIDDSANAVWMIRHEPSQLLKFSRKHASMCDLLDSTL